MAEKKQQWRETTSYASDSEEEDKHDAPVPRHLTKSIAKPQSSFNHPVYKKISRVNNFINSLTTKEIRCKLTELGLSDKGDHNVVSRRLKNWVKTSKLQESNVITKGTNIDYIVVIDFEATCEEDNPSGFRHEIIEFPAVLINVKEKEIVAEFHSFCKPSINPELTQFCISLTGITQDKVESAPHFSTVLKRFDCWLKTVLTSEDTFAILTDGPWDIAKFLVAQCKSSKIALPFYFKTWINVRKHFRNYYNTYKQNLEGMLQILGMQFEGRPHSGIDDTRNIARIAIQLLKDGCELVINETFG